RTAGHEVTVATSPEHARLVHGARVAFVPLEGDPNDLMAGAQSQAWLAAGHNPARFKSRLGDLVGPLADQLLEDAWAACEDAEALVSPPLSPLGYHLADALGIPRPLAPIRPIPPNPALA